MAEAQALVDGVVSTDKLVADGGHKVMGPDGKLKWTPEFDAIHANMIWDNPLTG